jgi:hypothetical protein
MAIGKLRLSYIFIGEMTHEAMLKCSTVFQCDFDSKYGDELKLRP